ncbi:MAG TPA: TetR/AcrR family transcriptional regulator [Solirubrobacterales bacterium]|nr:TetR/AcrR family transcriptional regulator [Solirubrobacterales bacterium]
MSREFVAENQRERLLTAIAETLDELGYEKTTVSSIGAHAHVSKSDFYRHFDSKDECFIGAYDDATAQLREEVVSGCIGRQDWADGICAGLSAGLAWLAAEPAKANLLLVEGLRAGRDVYERYLAALQSFVPYLRDGAPEAVLVPRPLAAADEAVVGGVASLIGRRVMAGEADRLEQFFPEVAQFALAPYLGAAEARRIISGR